MDDGKCLLDVISDPQALKEFFRSPSQIGFVDSDLSPVKSTDNNTATNDGQKQENVTESVIRNKQPAYVSTKQTTSVHTTQAGSGGAVQPQQTKPLVHFSYPASSTLSLNPVSFASNTRSPVKNGGEVLNTSSGQVHYVTSNHSGNRGINLSLTQTNLAPKHAVSTSHNLHTGLTVCKENAPRSFVNTPLSFAFGDASKARTILSGSGTHVVSSMEKTTGSSSNLGVSQQMLGHNVQLKQSPPKLISNVTTATGPAVRTASVKGSPLAHLRPKKIVPRPVAQQNVSTVVSGDQSSFLSQGGKGKVVNTGKGQPLIAIQPKLIITSQSNVVTPGISTQGNLSSSISIGSKLPLTNPALNSLLIQQVKPGVQTVGQVPQNKVPVANLVQLQPKQIAPKPGQGGISFQVAGNQKLSQEQIQQQLVQNLLGKSQQNQTQQFVLQQGNSPVLKDDNQSNSIEKQQNQLKELLQRNHLLQQVIQVQRLQHQQNASSASGTQVNMIAGQSQLDQKPLGQSSPLLSLMNSTLAQQNVALTAGQSANTTNNLSGGTTAKQLQEFLDKNPQVAQQLKQINLKQGINVTRTLNTSTATVSATKNPVQLQKPAQSQLTTPSLAATHKKVVVSSHATQAQAVGTSQVAVTDQKVTGAQKVLLVQQSNTGAAPVGQPRVLLQTKEGRPILLTQEQFKQIQQQLASKNLTIQAKLVTTTTTAPQVVVKPSDATTAKPIPKVSTTTTHVKQEIAKGLKRAVKAVETEESKLIKRMKAAVQKDQNDVSFIDVHKPFGSHEQAVKKLLPFHVFSEPEPNGKMQHKANALLDKLALQLTKKSDRMINKYRHLLLGDMQREVPSAELVMVNRIFLADEKAALMNEKKRVLEEARKMTKSLTSNETDTSSTVREETKTDISSEDSSYMKSNERALDFLLNSTTTLAEDASSPMSLPEQHQVEIMDDSPSPMASANSFLSHISTNSTLNLLPRTPNYTHEPS